MEDSPFFRYRRQTLLEEFDDASQQKLLESKAVLVGCGGLGTVIASYLVRSGVGELTIVDPDLVSLDNLQRQILFNEKDEEKKANKAEAASKKLRKINSNVKVIALPEKLSLENAELLFRGKHLIFDATDNIDARFLINEICYKLKIPWIYGGVVATYGNIFTVIPDETACFRCFFDEAPDKYSFPSCREIGVLGPSVAAVASVQVSEGLKLLTGRRDLLFRKLVNVDIWHGEWDLFDVEKRPGCPVCG